MKHRARLGIPGVILVSGALALGGLATAYEEIESFAAGGMTPAARFAALGDTGARWAPSLLSKRLVLDTCLEAINGPYGKLQPGESRRIVIENCRTSADAIVSETPSLSFGWFVGALAAASLGDTGGFNTRVRNSQITGPAEQWVAELRIKLVEDNYASAAPDVLTRHHADLRLLVASPRGISSIADRYANMPDFRGRIAAIVETLPEADQARFVAEVRRAAAQTNGIQ